MIKDFAATSSSKGICPEVNLKLRILFIGIDKLCQYLKL